MNASRAWFEKDFYAVLGVPEGASADEIKRAYKKLAQRYHPDRNPGDKVAEEKMKDISEAYDVLSDQKKRQEYDQVRRLARSGYVGGEPGGRWETTINPEDIPFDLSDLFGDLFGGARRSGSRRQRRGADVETTVRISLEDVVRGTTVVVPTGSDRVRVKIPAGIGDGARVRVRGRGAVGAGDGVAGDLYVRVQVEPHERFARAGDDLTVVVPVSFAAAALGGTIEVPTIDGGPVRLRVPAGTQSGKTFRVRGRGVPRSGGARGDLLVTVHVAVPSPLTAEQRELVERLAALDGSDVSAPRAEAVG